jgi:predicted GNAT superfamily acetyltransferase
VAGSEAVIEIRQLSALEDLREVVALQQEIWGFADAELLPLRFFVVASRVGGHVLGAYRGEKLVAFCLGIPGHKPGPVSYIHSHMLGVRPEYQNLGLGRRLKLEQRRLALAAGIRLIEWTFDPLELKNAFFNIERLGAIVRRYAPNNYGLTASPLHGGLPTDRCYAEWWISSARVHEVLKPSSAPQRLSAESKNAAYTAVSYPADIAEIRAQDQARAREIQKQNGDAFQKAFAAGLAVTRFERAETQGIYLLEPLRPGDVE